MDSVNEAVQGLLAGGIWKQMLLTVGLLVGLGVLEHVITKVVARQTDDPQLRYRWRKATSYTMGAIALVGLGWIWLGLQGTSLATFFGLLSAGLAVALKDMLVDVAGWGFIVWRRPFTVGDRIQVGDFAGDVVDQRIFQFTLLEIGNWVDADQSTGRVIHVPNGWVFNHALSNYSQGLPFIWNELPVLVTFESDWRKAKELLREIALRHGPGLTRAAEEAMLRRTDKFVIHYSTLQPTVYTSVKDSGVMLTIRCVCDPRRRRGTAEAIWEDVLAEFEKHDDIDFAYPTWRVYDNVVEGKQQARAEPLSRQAPAELG